jgi:hypothetical protein
VTRGGYPNFRDLREFYVYDWVFENVLDAVASEKGATNSTKAAASLLEDNDPHAAYETWALDTQHRPYRYYPLCTDTGTVWGPMIHNPDYPNLVRQPLKAAIKQHGDIYIIPFGGMDDPR